MKHNPIIEGLYADPDVIKAEGKYYLYPTTDGFAGWSGHEFYAFSSEDKKHWKKEGRILDLKTEVPWAVGSAWAPCAAARNGKYYFYFCGKKPDGESCIGMAVSESPAGPFRAEDKPLVTMEDVKKKGIFMWQVIDPSICREDGRFWLLFGNGGAACVELTEDMTGIKPETMTQINGLEDFREAVHVFKRGGLYHFTWSCDDTGREDYHVNYGTSECLTGPVEYHYPVLEKRPEKDILGTGHHTILEDDGQYSIFYHRFATPLADYPDGKGYHREVCMDEISFDEKGLMRKVEPQE